MDRLGPRVARRRPEGLEHTEDQAQLVAVFVAAAGLEQRRWRRAQALGEHDARGPHVQAGAVGTVSE